MFTSHVQGAQILSRTLTARLVDPIKDLHLPVSNTLLNHAAPLIILRELLVVVKF